MVCLLFCASCLSVFVVVVFCCCCFLLLLLFFYLFCLFSFYGTIFGVSTWVYWSVKIISTREKWWFLIKNNIPTTSENNLNSSGHQRFFPPYLRTLKLHRQSSSFVPSGCNWHLTAHILLVLFFLEGQEVPGVQYFPFGRRHLIKIQSYQRVMPWYISHKDA